MGVKSQAKAEVEKLAKVTDPLWKEKDKLESFMEQFANKSWMQLQNYFYGLKASL